MKPTVYFLHANGIPAKTYNSLFEKLDVKEVLFKNCIGLEATKQKTIKNWKPFRDEVIDDLKRINRKGMVAIGHSMGGAVALMAEIKCPGLFSHIILLDPVVFRPVKSFFAQVSARMGLMENAPIVAKAKKRTDHFDSREAAAEYWQRRKFFQRFEEQSFLNYLQHGLSEAEEGFSLTIPRDHEYQVFKSGANSFSGLKSNLKVTLIRAQKGSVMDLKDVKWLQRRLKNIHVEEAMGTHMFPLEAPTETAQAINKVL